MAEKRGPGRPKGAKNKKTLERERLQAAARRGPGRPMGSRNKPKLAEQPVKKKRFPFIGVRAVGWIKVSY